MSGLSGPDRTNLRLKAIGRLGLSLPGEGSERHGQGPRQYVTGSVDPRPYQPVDAIELLSLLRRLRTGETSWSSVNQAFLPYIRQIYGLFTSRQIDVSSGQMVPSPPFITPLNPISFEVLSTTPHGVTSSLNGDTAKKHGTSSSSASVSEIIRERLLQRRLDRSLSLESWSTTRR